MKAATAFILLVGGPLWAQYAGPAILSRGEAPVTMALPQINFHPFLEVSGTYEDGLAAPSLNNQGQLVSTHSYGVGLVWGIGGVHSWRHTRVGLDYRGSLTHFAQQQGFDSLEQSLMLGVKHQVSPHISVELRETAGMTNRDFGQRGLRDTVPFDPSTTFVPTTDYFDNRTIYSTSTASLAWQKTARLSIYLGGDAFLVRRRSTALFDTTGVTAHGDAQYRVSRSSTIGVNYGFMRFTYGGVSGDTQAHGLSGTYSLRVSRNVELSGYAGAYRIESNFIQNVAVDPAIAALLGISSVSQIVYRVDYRPQFAARLTRRYHKGLFFVSGGESVNPGNGVFVTSTAIQALTGYSYTGLRRWSFGVSGGYERADSIGIIAGRYSDSQQGLQLSREIGGHLHFIASYSARQYSSPDYANYSRNVNEARLGIGYSPGDIPLRIW